MSKTKRKVDESKYKVWGLACTLGSIQSCQINTSPTLCVYFFHTPCGQYYVTNSVKRNSPDPKHLQC